MIDPATPAGPSRLLLRAFPWIVVALVLAGWASLLFENGYYDPLMFGSAFRAQSLPEIKALVPVVNHEYGYDGQFYAQMAVTPDPTDAGLVGALDTPSYRLRRIGWPLLIHLAGFGNPAAILHLYLWSNLFCWLALSALFWRQVQPHGWKGAIGWFALVTSIGMLSSVRCAVLDVPAMLILYLALLARTAGRMWVCALMLALASLVRETSILGLVLLWPDDPRSRRAWLKAAGCALVAAIPVLAWTAWLGGQFGWGTSAGAGNIALPGSALIERAANAWKDCATEGFSRRTLWPLVTWIGLVFQVVCLVRWMRPTSHLARIGLLFAGLMLVVGSSVWGGWAMATPRAVLPMSVASVFVALERRVSWYWILPHVLVAMHGWDMLKLPLLRHVL